MAVDSVRTLATALLAVAILIQSGCGPGRDTVLSPLRTTRPELASVVIVQRGGLPGPGYLPGQGPLRNTLAPSGFVVAVWQDGRMVRAKDPEQLGWEYVEGRLRSDDLPELVRLVQAAVSSPASQHMVVVDAPFQEVCIRTAGGRTRFGESLAGISPSEREAQTGRRLRLWLFSRDLLDAHAVSRPLHETTPTD